VRDCARAFRTLVERENIPASGAYNISAADHMAASDSAGLAQRYYPGVPARSGLAGRRSFFSNARAETAFGYSPQYSWMEETPDA